MLGEPVVHEGIEFVGQAKEHMACLPGAPLPRFAQDRLDLVVVERRDYRGGAPT
jgi:hypothetical protein